MSNSILSGLSAIKYCTKCDDPIKVNKEDDSISDKSLRIVERPPRNTWLNKLSKVLAFFKCFFGFGEAFKTGSVNVKLRKESVFEIILNKELIKTLDKEFGNVKISIPVSTKVQIPVKLAKQLYAACLESICRQEESLISELNALKEETGELENVLSEGDFIDEDWNSASLVLLDEDYNVEDDYDLDEIDSSHVSEVHRQTAQKHYERSKEFFQKAKQSYELKNYNLIHFYRQKALKEIELAEDANHMAVQILLEENSRQISRNCIDLHHFRVREAIKIVDDFLDNNILDLENDNLDMKTLMIITGRGKHSPGGIPRIKPAVCERLKQRHLRSSEINPGTLQVKIYQKSMLTDEIDN